jgi:hypothetical protein
MFNGSVGFQNLNWFLNSGFRVQGLGNGLKVQGFWKWVEAWNSKLVFQIWVAGFGFARDFQVRWRSTVRVVELDQGRDGKIVREILPDVQHASVNHTFKHGYDTLLSCPGRSSYKPFQFQMMTSIST